jgi:hypothetical protein
LLDAGITTGVITNGGHDQQKSKVRSIELGSESMGQAKLRPEAFHLPGISFGPVPDNVLHVGAVTSLTGK